MKGANEIDPRGLIAESYRIEGIEPGECRSIFLDWALGAPDGADALALIEKLVAQYESVHPDHPMTRVLKDALGAPTRAGRRGGARARRQKT